MTAATPDAANAYTATAGTIREISMHITRITARCIPPERPDVLQSLPNPTTISAGQSAVPRFCETYPTTVPPAASESAKDITARIAYENGRTIFLGEG